MPLPVRQTRPVALRPGSVSLGSGLPLIATAGVVAAYVVTLAVLPAAALYALAALATLLAVVVVIAAARRWPREASRILVALGAAAVVVGLGWVLLAVWRYLAAGAVVALVVAAVAMSRSSGRGCRCR